MSQAQGSSKPTFVLKMKGEDGKLVTLTGLFEGETKGGIRRLSGFDKNSDVGFSLLPQTDRKSGAETGNLSLSFKEGKDGKFEKLALMEKAESKNGEMYYRGKSEDGVEYLVYPKTEQGTPAAAKPQPAKGFTPRPQTPAPAAPRGAPKSPAAPQPRRSFGPPARA